jgi:hypothetical protein
MLMPFGDEIFFGGPGKMLAGGSDRVFTRCSGKRIYRKKIAFSGNECHTPDAVHPRES